MKLKCDSTSGQHQIDIINQLVIEVDDYYKYVYGQNSESIKTVTEFASIFHTFIGQE